MAIVEAKAENLSIENFDGIEEAATTFADRFFILYHFILVARQSNAKVVRVRIRLLAVIIKLSLEPFRNPFGGLVTVFLFPGFLVVKHFDLK